MNEHIYEGNGIPDAWYVALNNQQLGPYPLETLRQMAAAGTLGPATLVWRSDLPGWRPASSLPAFSDFWPLPVAPPPFMPAAAPQAYPYYAGPAMPLYAGFWKRVAASLIDGVLLTIAGSLIGGILGFLMGVVMAAGGSDMVSVQLATGVVGYIIGIIINWLYYTLFESSSKQATPGKLLLGIKVTDLSGQPIGFGRANGRYWGKIISGLTLCIGFIMAGFTEKKQCLHDMMAGCLVINK